MKGITIAITNMNIFLSNTINKLINIFKINNYKCFLVGGAVRDILLNLNPKEYDFATDAPTNKIKSLFEKYIDVGEPYGCIKIFYEDMWFEITTFRIDYGYDDFRHPKTVKFISSPQLDSIRRDFTINSIYTDGITVIDPFNGINDLENNLIRLIGNKNLKLIEDPLRILRILKFKSKLNFKIEFLTLMALKNNINLINKLNKYRLHEELSYIFNNTYFYDSIDIFRITHGFKIIFNNKELKINEFKNIKKLINNFHIKIFCILYFHSNIDNSLIIPMLINNLNFNKNELYELEIIFKILEEKKFCNIKLLIKQLILIYNYDITYKILNVLNTYYSSCKNILKIFYKIKWGYEPIKYNHLNIELHNIIKNKRSINKYKKYLITLAHINPHINEKNILTHLIKLNSKFF